MYLSQLRLWNFRKYGTGTFDIEKPDFSLNFSKSLNVLIGENDSGKSAIIDAIKLVLKTHSQEWIRVESEDFFENSTRFRIELFFEDLNKDEAKNFIDWLSWQGEDEEAKCFLRLILDVKRNAITGDIFPTEVKAGADVDGITMNADAREYLKTTYLRPLRDAASELIPKKNSRLSQILQGHDAFKGRKHTHSLVETFGTFNKDIKNYFDGTDAAGLKITDQAGLELKTEINTYIKAFSGPGKESVFGVNDGNLKHILEKLELSLKDVINPGLGTLNRLFMSSELLHLKKRNWTGLKLGLIEELEAHLHPQAQMQVIEALREQQGIQLILTTHSPNLASKVNLEHLIICQNGQAFPMGPDYTLLDSLDYKFLENFLDVTKSNLFFAKGVILVEGWAEEILIPIVANKMGINLTQSSVSIVNIGSLAFDRYKHIFLRKNKPDMDIPVAVVTDCDIREYTMESKTITKALSSEIETQSQTKAAEIVAKSEKNIKYFPTVKWTLEYALYHSKILSSLFIKAVKRVHPGMVASTNFEEDLANKLLKGTLDKTEIAYQLASLIKEDELLDLNKIETDDSIYSLIEAIKYASSN